MAATPVTSPAPAAVISPSAKPPVAATAPKMAIPTAAPISTAAKPVASVPAAAAAPSSSSGGFFSSLASKVTSRVEAAAPGLVAAVKEQVAAAQQKQAEKEAEKKQHKERIIEQATSPAAFSAATSTSPDVAQRAVANTPGKNVAHIPGLGAVALAPAAASADGKKSSDHAWNALASPPVAAPIDPAALLEAEAAAIPSSDKSQSAQSELRHRGANTKAAPKTEAGGRGSFSSNSATGGQMQQLQNVSEQSASQASGVGSYKMDLPLRLCLVILKKTSAEMKDKYTEYLSTKQKRREGDEPLSFPQFMFFSTIRTLPDFIYKKTELAFCMMREEGDTLVFLENFRRYAPILQPLASKLDAEPLYHALEKASVETGAAMSQEQVDREDALDEEEDEEETSGSTSSQPPIRPKRRAGGVAFPQFKLYVEHLKKYCPPDSTENGWPEFRSLGSDSDRARMMEKHEQLLVVRTGVTDTTSFPPRIGRLGLTTNFLLYESSFFNRRRCIRWTNVVRIEANEDGFWRKGGTSVSGVAKEILHPTTSSSTGGKEDSSTPTKGMKIYLLEDDSAADGSAASATPNTADGALSAVRKDGRKEICLTMDIPGWTDASVLERTRTFEYIRILIHLHKLVAAIPDKVVASALVQETCMTIQRMRALESVGHGCDPLLLNPFPGYDLNLSLKPQEKLAVKQANGMAEEVGAGVVPSPASASSFVSSIQDSINRADAIRKSKSSWLFKVLPGLQNKEEENLQEDIDPELAALKYKTAEELLKLRQGHEQPFSLKNFAYNVKLFRYEIEPLMLFIALVKRVRDWENPIVTLMTIMLLLNMAYRDYLMYLPAMLIFLNIAIVAILRYYPNAVWSFLGGETKAEKEKGGDASVAASSAIVEELGPDGLPIEEEFDGASTSHSSSGKSSIPTAHPVTTPTKKDEPEGLLAKLKNYRDVAVKTKDYLHSVQNSVGEQNVKFMKLEGLYKWRSPQVTQKFFLMLCAGFLVMVFIPFRFIFPVLGQFWGEE